MLQIAVVNKNGAAVQLEESWALWSVALVALSCVLYKLVLQHWLIAQWGLDKDMAVCNTIILVQIT